MNYYDARQRQSDGKWDFTCHNRRMGTWPIGTCGQQRCEHNTPDEARECYRQYILDQMLKLDHHEFKPWVECEAEGCDFDTNKAAQAGNYFHWALCPKHMNKETVAGLLKVGSFMGSY